MIKYKIKDLAADFGMQSKDIMQLVEKFFEKPKSNSQVLTEEQLNVLFDYITQTNQIESLAVVFDVAPAPKAEEPKATVGQGLAPADSEAPKEKKAEQEQTPATPKAPKAATAPKAEPKPEEGAAE